MGIPSIARRVTGPALLAALVASAALPVWAQGAGTVLLGDLNGDGRTDIGDVVLDLKIVVGALQPTPQQLAAGDINGDGQITIQDALHLLQALVGGVPLPVGPSGPSPNPAPPGGTGPSTTPTPPDGTGVTLALDQPYPGGTRVQAPWVGASFVIPQEWTGEITSKTRVFALTSPSHPVVAGWVYALATAPNKPTTASVAPLFGQPINLGGGVVFTPDGPPQVDSAHLSQSYHASSLLGPLVGYTYGLVADTGNALAFTVGGMQKDSDYLQSVLNGLVASARLTGPDPAVTGWLQLLAGGEVTFVGGTYTPGAGVGDSIGTDSQNIFDMCRNGSLIYTYNGYFSTGEGSGEGHNQTMGSWEIAVDLIGPAVLFIPGVDGRTTDVHRIATDGRNTALDGTAVSYPANSACSAAGG